VHCPLAHSRLLPQPWPSGVVVSAGHVEFVPLHTSSGLHDPVLGRHTVPFVASWQPRQHSSFASSHTDPVVNLHVFGSQHLLLPHPSVPPQSQSSPSSTIPLPHSCPVIVVTPVLSLRQSVLTLLRPIAEQMLPIVHGENDVTPSPVDGFMMNCPPASHVELLRGQHC
jgi:hypothetical protein